MVYRVEELQYKEVIDITDGTRYGFVGDVELNPQHGSVEGIVVRGHPRWFGLLGREPDIVFPWPAIRRFGEDIILVDGSAAGQNGNRSFS